MSRRIVVLSGSCSKEREVSLRSASAVKHALEQLGLDHTLIRLDKDELPEGLDAGRDVVFPVLHGGFGEGGELQRQLEERGIEFAGCDSKSSLLCMVKPEAKRVVSRAGVPVPLGLTVATGAQPEIGLILDRLGDDLVIKPAAEGSSVGLTFARGKEALENWLKQPCEGDWLIEKRVVGRELTVGILQGRAMGVVEVLPATGVYDYSSKYTSGATQYRYPAELELETANRIRGYAVSAFLACGCRDFARADFMLDKCGEAFFLELNTLPGMTETSLLPKSASCNEVDFRELVQRMVSPALKRAQNRTTNAG